MNRVVTILFLMLLIPFSIFAQSSIPTFFQFQSVLTDDGGNPLLDGPINVAFRLLDADHKVLYQEVQQVDVRTGKASAMIGNGLLPDVNAPTGGIPAELFASHPPRFLEVQAEGFPAEGPFELTSVPYAFVANRVVDGSVSGAMLQDKSIQLKHFADGALSDVAKAMVEQNLLVTKNDLETIYKAPGGAANIGVSTGLSHSAATNLDGVIKDLDRAIEKRQVNISALTVVSGNVNRRIDNDILGERGAIQRGDDVLAQRIRMLETGPRIAAWVRFTATISEVEIDLGLAGKHRRKTISQPEIIDSHNILNVNREIMTLSENDIFPRRDDYMKDQDSGPIFHVTTVTPFRNAHYAVIANGNGKALNRDDDSRIRIFNTGYRIDNERQFSLFVHGMEDTSGDGNYNISIGPDPDSNDDGETPDPAVIDISIMCLGDLSVP